MMEDREGVCDGQSHADYGQQLNAINGIISPVNMLDIKLTLWLSKTRTPLMCRYAHTRSLHNVTALVHTGILQCSTDERVNDGAKQTGHTAKHNDRPLGWAQVQGVCVDRVDDDQVVCDADRNAAQETDEIK